MALECEHDWDGVIATFAHPRYEMHSSGAVFDGEAEVRKYFHDSRVTFPDLTNEVISIASDPEANIVLVEFWLRGTHEGPIKVNGRIYEGSGRKFELRMTATFEFEPTTDKIICERPYLSSDARLRSLGLL